MIPSVDNAGPDMFPLERINVAPLCPKVARDRYFWVRFPLFVKLISKGNTEARYLVRNNLPTLVAFRILIARSASDLEVK